LRSKLLRGVKHEAILPVLNQLTQTAISTAISIELKNREEQETGLTDHLKSTAQTGRPHPNMSTTFIGRSSPDEDVCRLTPRSALPASKNA
jgi:hypothetical protein